MGSCCPWLQDASITTTALNCFPSLQRLTLHSRAHDSLTLQQGPGPWEAPAQLRRMAAHSVDALQLLPILQAATGLQALQLEKLSGSGMAALAPVLQQMTDLQDLLLGNNYSTQEVAVTVAPALQLLTGLRRLDLQSCSLGPLRMAALAPALRHLTGLEEL